MKCHDANGGISRVNFRRDRITITSYSNDAIRTNVETGADTVAALAGNCLPEQNRRFSPSFQRGNSPLIQDLNSGLNQEQKPERNILVGIRNAIPPGSNHETLRPLTRSIHLFAER